MSKIRLHGTSSGYVEIAPAAAAGNNTLTAPSTVGEIIAKDAAGAIGVTSMKASNVNVGAAVTITESGIEASGIGITCANINGNQIGGRRNIIINGAMNVAQRGTSHTPSNSTSTYQLDRFIMENSNAGAYTISQSSTVPDNQFKHSLKVDVTTADTSLTSAQYCQFQQRVEAQNLQAVQNFRQPMTFSFWVRSNKTGNYSFTLQQSDNSSRQMSGQYTISVANTWEKKIITVPADSSGAVNDDNGIGMTITWGLAYGSNYTSGSLSTNNAFKNYNVGDFGAGQGVNILDSTSNEWYLTGVQMEIGTQATAFEHRSLGEELALCQRYYQQYVNPCCTGVVPDNGSKAYSIGLQFQTRMRAVPTLSITNAGTGGNVSDGQSTQFISSLSAADRNVDGASMYLNLAGDLGDFRPACLGLNDSTSNTTTYKFAAEL